MKYFERIIFYLTVFLFITALTYFYHNVDNDLWARLLQGDYVLKTGHVMYNDPFSYVKVHDWIDHEWGSGVIFSLIKNCFNYTGLVMLKAVLIFSTVFFIIMTVKISGLKSTKLYNLLFFFFLIHSFETILPTGIRCHYFSFAFFAIFLYILENARINNKNGLLYIIPLLMIFWLNIHGGCISGIGLLIMYIIGEALNKRPCKKYIYTLAATIPVFLINPYGFKYISFLFHATTMPRPYIVEWSNIFDNTLIKSKIFSVIAILTFLSLIYENIKNKNKPDFTRYLVITVTCILAFLHVKHFPFFIISSSAFLYDKFYENLNRFILKIKNILKIQSEKSIKTFVRIKETIVYCFIILGSISILYSNFSTEVSAGALNSYPVKIAEFMKINNLSGNILNHFGIGSYLAYKLYPQNLIYIDGRYEEVYYDDTVEDNYNFYNNIPVIIDNKPETEIYYNVFKKEGFPEYIIAQKDDYTLPVLNSMQNYKRIYEEDYYLLFIRTDLLKDKYLEPPEDKNYYISTFFNKLET